MIAYKYKVPVTIQHASDDLIIYSFRKKLLNNTERITSYMSFQIII